MIFLVIISLIALYLFHELYWKRRNLPPGPTPIPLVGNLIDIYKHEPGYQAHLNWYKEFGPVYTYWLGSIPTVAVSDYETMKESFVKDGETFAGRFSIANLTELYRGGDYGLVEIDGDHWREQRRFTLTMFREFGMGRNLMEHKVMAEVDAMLERLSSHGDSVDIRQEFDIGIGSIINSLLFGYRYEGDRLEDFLGLKHRLNDQMKQFGNPMWFMMMQYPVLKHLPKFKDVWKTVFNTRDEIYGLFAKQIADKKKEIDYDTEVKDSNDYVEAYLKEQRKRKDEPEEGGYSDIQLVNVVSDLWTAGLETTSTTLTWAIVYLLNHPEVTEKIYEELDTVIQSDRKIVLADKNNLPYLNATICEVQRLANLLPQNLFHETTKDTIVGGHRIAKGTCIVPMLCTALFDEKIFPNHEKFEPSRFINKDGTFKKVEELIPFSLGKRQCMGEGLAKMELFLFLANIMQRFRIRSDTVPSMRKVASFTVQPENFLCTLVDRRS